MTKTIAVAIQAAFLCICTPVMAFNFDEHRLLNEEAITTLSQAEREEAPRDAKEPSGKLELIQFLWDSGGLSALDLLPMFADERTLHTGVCSEAAAPN